MSTRWIAYFLFFIAAIGNSAATSFPPASVPDPLKSWIPWVLDETPDSACPYLFNNADKRHCAWPGALELRADGQSATFAQEWMTYRQTWVALPGSDKHWPQEVSVDGNASAVLGRNGRPSIALTPGAHRVTGRFVWKELPESLALPEDAGILQLEVHDQVVNQPARDENNRLWLQNKTRVEGAEEVQIHVYRKIADGIPITAETRIRLDVSGKSREIAIDRALLPDFIPLELSSPLPATLTPDGGLKVQARAGTWRITLTARHPGPVKALALPAAAGQGAAQSGGLSAEEEVWVFQAAPLLRSASIEGAPAVDPQQTTLPDEWRNLPSYLMRPEAAFRFKEIRRGDSDPAPDKLALERRLWLSFDGKTMTMSDRIQGNINRAARLSMGEPTELGRVAIDDQDQLITRGSDELAGVEVKRGRFAMTADSLILDAPHRLPAVGWKHDFDRASTQLALPPGWRLLHVGGADRADGAWLAQWNLLDFFLVLVVALAVGRLWGHTWGALALATLILSYQEAGAPIYEWIVLLAAVALHRVLPSGRVKNVTGWVRKISLLTLVLLALGFATSQVRSALYPILEQGAYFNDGGSGETFRPEPLESFPVADHTNDVKMEEAQHTPSEPSAAASAPASRMLSSAPPLAKRAMPQQQIRQYPYQVVDPDAKVQTGPGLPNWRWKAYRISWDGPVRQDQMIDLWLLSPTMNKVLIIVRLALLALLLARVSESFPPASRLGSGGRRPRPAASSTPSTPSASFAKLASMAFLAALLGTATLHSAPASAAQPSQEQLEALKKRLTRPADCLPECAEIAHLTVTIVGPTLHLALDVDAAIDTVLPLPGGAKHWLPNDARLDGETAHVQRDPEGGLWLLAPAGRHRLDLKGALPPGDVLQLPLPRTPRRVDVNAEGWDVAGISDESGVADTLQLSRQVKVGKSVEAPALPPFLRVERRLILGLEWQVETTVSRDSPDGVPALAQIPLLPGEAVTTPGVAVQDGKVLVNLGPQTDRLSWSARLAQQRDLKLLAPNDSAWVETWIIAASSLWHVDTDGLPPVAIDSADDGALADLAFKPWPGEALTLKIERPQATLGKTLTIDRSDLRVTPGSRATDYQLRLNVRSSRGVDHAMTLPDGAILQRVSINGQARPIRANGGQLVIPLTPGKQNIDLAWRLDQGVTTSYATAATGLGQESVNSRITLNVPYDRWLLFASGPGVGPAILFWGKLIVLLAVAFALGRFSGLPIKTRQWVLLALGLTQVDWWAATLVIAWFYAFALRGKSSAETTRHWLFNLRQLALVALTLAMISVLFDAVQGGLLGHPEMQIVGNGSGHSHLSWYLDRARAELQGAWILTLPILVYRGLMLAWALWLAWSLLAWLKWGWNAFGQGELWRRKAKLARSDATDDRQAEKHDGA